ncbi:MAG: aldehyde dehydrogenase family protein, partial [Pseudomonadota bacterium]
MAVFEDIRSAPSHVIDGESLPGGGATFMSSINPYSGETLWSGCAATASDTEHAVQACRQALSSWRATPYEDRKAIVLKFATLVSDNLQELAHLMCSESGKVLREARQELQAIVAYGQACANAYEAQCATTSSTSDGKRSATRYEPYGTLAVIGPFNLPMSRANSHIMPALLAGNTIVFKPSQHTPLCGVALALLWQQAGLPRGVLNSLTGGQAAGEQLAAHPDVDGVLFVGGHEAGMAIFETVKHHPDKILSLDMGGNNPLIVHDVPAEALEAASRIAIQSAFSGAGQ